MAKTFEDVSDSQIRERPQIEESSQEEAIDPVRMETLISRLPENKREGYRRVFAKVYENYLRAKEAYATSKKELDELKETARREQARINTLKEDLSKAVAESTRAKIRLTALESVRSNPSMAGMAEKIAKLRQNEDEAILQKPDHIKQRIEASNEMLNDLQPKIDKKNEEVSQARSIQMAFSASAKDEVRLLAKELTKQHEKRSRESSPPGEVAA